MGVSERKRPFCFSNKSLKNEYINLFKDNGEERKKKGRISKMNKRDLKRATAVALSVMLSVAYVPDATRAETKNVAVKAAKKSKKSKKSKKPVGFKISRTSGTYDKKVTVKVRAKKKYKVYYTTKRKFKKKMVIKPGKLKTFKFDKTTTLRLFAVKKSKKMTTKKLNKKATSTNSFLPAPGFAPLTSQAAKAKSLGRRFLY